MRGKRYVGLRCMMACALLPSLIAPSNAIRWCIPRAVPGPIPPAYESWFQSWTDEEDREYFYSYMDVEEVVRNIPPNDGEWDGRTWRGTGQVERVRLLPNWSALNMFSWLYGFWRSEMWVSETDLPLAGQFNVFTFRRFPVYNVFSLWYPITVWSMGWDGQEWVIGWLLGEHY